MSQTADLLKELKKVSQAKKAVDISNLSISERTAISKSSSKYVKGVACGKLFEPIPKYIKAKCEKVVKGDNNTFIVFGRDRPKSVFSGYGGLGHTGAGSIDVVVGRMSCLTPKSQTAEGATISIDPDFKNDAARIYISQKTDVDENFNISDIPRVPDSTARSAIALKADDVRLLARETIKLCTAMDPLNSQNGSIKSVGGIYLIAGPAVEEGDEVQSIAKGEATSVAIGAVLTELENLKQAFDGFLEKQMEFNSYVANHTHISPFYAKPTLPSKILQWSGQKTSTYHLEKTKMSIVGITNNIKSADRAYLKKDGEQYIGSRHNKTN
tara:strand:- start:2338 stop:3315 length:978 start_codon:yes stop_codon:yes gene_type:complete